MYIVILICLSNKPVRYDYSNNEKYIYFLDKKFLSKAIFIFLDKNCHKIIPNGSFVEPEFKTLLFLFYLSTKLQLPLTYFRIHSLNKTYS